MAVFVLPIYSNLRIVLVEKGLHVSRQAFFDFGNNNGGGQKKAVF
jgi:hypothetical protein